MSQCRLLAWGRGTLFAVIASMVLLAGKPATAAVINFEGFADSTALTNQIAGLTFTNSGILSAGISLNEFEFPPHSGVNVVVDNGGAMTIAFSAPQTSVSAFITYAAPLTFQAFNSGNSLLASVSSAFSINAALSGDPGSSPNELFSITQAGITKLVITGDPSGASFVLDDLTFSARAVAVPEPGMMMLFLLALTGLLLVRTKPRGTMG